MMSHFELLTWSLNLFFHFRVTNLKLKNKKFYFEFLTRCWKIESSTSSYCNLGQKVGDKFTKLGEIGFSMVCFTADFLRLFTEKRQNLFFGWMGEYSPSNTSISEIFLKFPNFRRSSVLSRSAVREATRTFTLWWK